MFFKHLDFLSPKVTFYYRGFLSHASIISGILSVISIIFIIYLTIYYSIEIFKRKTPDSFFFNSFINDAGVFKLNPSSLFHFVNYAQIIKGIETNEGFDFTNFNIIGASAYVDSYLNNKKGLEKMNHWLYGYCEKDINTEVIDDLLTYNFFENSACIKKFYNSSERKYYNLGDPKFVWPEIAHGTNNALNKIYGLYIQKCNNKTIQNILGDKYKCKSDLEINNFFNISNPRIINLYFINNFINALNYKYPNNKFFYRVENVFKKDIIIQNDLNFNPVIVQSHDGFVFDHIKEDISYKFERNDAYFTNNEGKNIYNGFCFLLRNTREYYVRIYKRVQDLISKIGGIFQAINIFAIYINSFYNNYIILSDTEKSLHSSIYTEKSINKKKLDKIKYSKIIKKEEKNYTNKKKSEKKIQQNLKIIKQMKKIYLKVTMNLLVL